MRWILNFAGRLVNALDRWRTSFDAAQALYDVGAVVRSSDLQPYIISEQVDRERARLLNLARRSCGYRRARYLLLLSGLGAELEDLEQFDDDSNQLVRLSLLLLRICCEPDSAALFVERYPALLQPLEVSCVESLLEQAAGEWSVGDALRSSSSNLKLVAMAQIVSQMDDRYILDLFDIIERTDNHRVGSEALLTLARREVELRDVRVRRYLAAMDDLSRAELLCQIVQLGYGEDVVSELGFGAQLSEIKGFATSLNCRIL